MSDDAVTMSIADVRLDADLYPRDSHDDATVTLYRDAIDRLPPIIVTHEGWLVDGYHRYLACIGEGHQEIAAEVITLDRDGVLLEAVRRNATHGKQLKRAEKQRLARALFSQIPQPKVAEKIAALAALLAVTDHAIRDWTKDLARAANEERDERMWQAWLACESAEAIGRREGVSPRTVDNDRVMIRALGPGDHYESLPAYPCAACHSTLWVIDGAGMYRRDCCAHDSILAALKNRRAS